MAVRDIGGVRHVLAIREINVVFVSGYYDVGWTTVYYLPFSTFHILTSGFPPEFTLGYDRVRE